MFDVGTICLYSSEYASERVRILEQPVPPRFSFFSKADRDGFYLVEPVDGGTPFRAREDELAPDPLGGSQDHSSRGED